MRAQIRALVFLPPVTGVLVAMCCAIAAGQEYMRRRAAMEQFLVRLALERSQREHATAVERRRAAVDSADRFEKSFGYICASAAAARASWRKRMFYLCICMFAAI
jgi:hypothetical protein